jgi:hypothetical protein
MTHTLPTLPLVRLPSEHKETTVSDEIKFLYHGESDDISLFELAVRCLSDGELNNHFNPKTNQTMLQQMIAQAVRRIRCNGFKLSEEQVVL